MLIHALRAGEQIGESVRTDGNHQRQTNRRPQRKTPAHPVPEGKDRNRSDAELDCTLRFGSQGSKVVGHCCGIAQIGHQPVTSRLRVEHRLLGRKRLAGHEEQGRAGIQRLQKWCQLSAIKIGDVVHAKCRM